MTPLAVTLELVATGLVIGFTVWVLGVQPLALAKGMARETFLPLQMRVVRTWSRTLVPLTVVGVIASGLRVGASVEAAPAIMALVGALVTARFAIPRALRAGGRSVRDDDDGPVTSAGFLSEGGGASTKVWHRVVLVGVLAVLGGRTVAASAAVSSLATPAPHAPDTTRADDDLAPAPGAARVPHAQELDHE